MRHPAALTFLLVILLVILDVGSGSSAKKAKPARAKAGARAAGDDGDGSARCGWMVPENGSGDGYARSCYDGMCCSVGLVIHFVMSRACDRL